MKRFLLTLALLCAVPAFPQAFQTNFSGGPPIPFAGVPSGSCSALQQAVNTTNGNLYTCNGGSWALATGTTAITGLTGGTQGQPVIATGPSSGGVASSQINASGFMAGVADPCTALIQSVNAAGSSGTMIEAAGIGAGTVFTGATSAGCGVLTSNFLKTSATAYPGTPIKGGSVHLGGFTLRISLVPSELGTCVNDSTATNCGALGPQFPPGAVLLCPNKVHCLYGIGRGDSGGINTSIQLCTGTNLPVAGCVAPVQRNWAIATTTATLAGGRNYLTVNVTANSANTNTSANVGIVGDGTKGTATLADYLAAGQLSSGQTVTISGGTFGGPTAVVVCQTNSQPTGCPAAGVSPPTINASGKVVFNFATAFNGTDAADTITIGSNIVAGEYVDLAGALPNSTNNDGTWRVCSQSNSNGTNTDPNCPVAVPTNTQFAVVAAKASLSTITRARDSVSCPSNCGSVYASIPMFDMGDPQTVTGKFQFATGAQDLSFNANGAGAKFPPPTVSGTCWRNIASDEQLLLGRVLCSNFSLWGADVHGTINQNAQEFYDNEFISGGDVDGYCQPGLAGAVFSDIGPRQWNGWTVNFGGCANLSPVAGLYIDVPTNSDVSNGHSENVQFGALLGQNYPAQSIIYRGDGGQATGSAVYLNGSCGTNSCPATNIIGSYDGPYQANGTLNGAVTLGTGVVITVAGLNPSTQCSTLENAVILDLCTGVGTPNTACAGASTFCSATNPCSRLNDTRQPGAGALGGEASTITATTATTITLANVKFNHPSGSILACFSPPAAVGISGNFQTAINGGLTPFTGDYSIHGVKKNTGGINSISDDYTAFGSTDNFISAWIVDTNGSGGCKSRLTTSGTAPSMFCNTIQLGSFLFSALPSAPNGSQAFCSDCNATCTAGSSAGRTCFREANAWTH